jgi:hypothetical protein
MEDVENSAILQVKELLGTPGISKEVAARIQEADKNAGKYETPKQQIYSVHA